MGRKLKQLNILVKKNFILLWQRKWQVLFELLLTFVLLLAFSFIRRQLDIQESCLTESKLTDPLQEIWKGDRNLIGMSPANSSQVVNLSIKMMGMKAFKLNDYIERKELTLGNYSQELDAIVRSNKRYLVLFPTNEIFEEYIKTRSKDLRAAIIFEGDDKNISYTIRYHNHAAGSFSEDWETDKLYPRNNPEKTLDKSIYEGTGFSALQRLVDASILLEKGVTYNPTVALRNVPSPAETRDQFVDNFISILLPISLLSGAFLLTSSISADIDEEKCSRMREIQRMMGLADSMMWISWIVQRGFIVIFCSAICTISLVVFKYMPSSDPTVLFVILLCYYSAHTSFAFFLTSLQRNIKSAPAAMSFLTFVSYLPYMLLSSRLKLLSRGVKILLSIFPLTGANIGLMTMIEWEKIRLGVQWSNIGKGLSVVDKFSVADVILMLLVDIVFYGILTWYIENVFPGESGVPKKPHFFLTKSYWLGSPQNEIDEDSERSQKESKLNSEYHERVTHQFKAGISIRNLNKKFKSLNGTKVAVKNLSLDMFEGQITALLGHNGAGKTTTINMLTGMYTPTSGEAIVGGHNIIDDMAGVRRSMGVCPQHNILFKYLTVQQHLEFFIRLKGIEDENEIKREIDFMLEALCITEKRHEMSMSLSGGMKRKLSVGIALSGGSKVVLLDEPSTGLDVSGKRDLWDMLLKLKQGRTIILTTHSMDEADLLGDRIAIMAAGQLVCSGSSLFLKRKYGVGYHLTLVKKSANMTEGQIGNLTAMIQHHVPSAHCNSNVGSELSYLLRASEVDRFVKLFQTLEDSAHDYGIASFGVSLTTMEEVFMKAGEGHDSNVAAIDAGEDKERKIRKFERNELNQGVGLLVQQYLCQLKKRAIVCLRNRFTTLGMFVFPIIFILGGLSASKSLRSVYGGVPIVLSLNEYPSKEIASSIYFADLRSSTEGGYADKIKSYMSSELNVKVKDVTANSTALIGSYDGTNEACCSNPFLQLNSSCIALGSEGGSNAYEVCYDKFGEKEFTYTNCRDSCLIEDVCTVSIPEADNVYENTNYFQNYFLRQATDSKGSFYIDMQGAITLSDTSNMYNVYNKEGNEIQKSSRKHLTAQNLVKVSTTDDIREAAGDVITGWVSYRGYHLIPAFQSAITNLVLMMNNKTARVTVTNAPLPKAQNEDSLLILPPGDTLVFVLTNILAGAFICATFTRNPIEERTNKSKHLQQISGINNSVYWLSMLSWDFLVYFSFSLIILVLVLIFEVNGLNKGEQCASFLFLMIISGLSSIPLVYILSHIFEKNTSAYGFVTMFNFIIPLTGFIFYMILNPATFSTLQTEGSEVNRSDLKWVDVVNKVLLFHPHYAFTTAMYNLMMLSTRKEMYSACLDLFKDTPDYCLYTKPDDLYGTEGHGIGRQVLAMIFFGIFYISLLIIVETWWSVIRAFLMRAWGCICSAAGKNGVSPAEDKNVTDERIRVESNLQDLINTESVVMFNLHRQYGKMTAVQNLSLGIAKGECFGLLGVNGAGKTTTFNMMTGDTVMTSGKGYLYGNDVTKQLRTAQKFIGYCPQFDAFIDYLTGRELLEMFANLRGVPKPAIDQTVDEVIKMFNLEDHADKECRSYSGGNKRKLSTGIAIIGSPPLIFLDEPTAGMDPTARRFLWDVLSYLRAAGCSIVLTSHSMEECEALCTRIVIMVNGACRCLGSIQELKNTYSQGYTVNILVEPENQSEVVKFVEEQFQGAVLKESYPGYLMFSLGTNYRWSYIFEVMETNKANLKLNDYSVSQTSLEQVFLNFAKEQRPPEEIKKGLFGGGTNKKVSLEKSRVSLKKSSVSQEQCGLLSESSKCDTAPQN
ncbi:hypothetical protein ACHWQZ_G009905 [Mnemiopsis leidyi]